MARIIPNHSRGVVDKAGRLLTSEDTTFDAYSEALAVVNNWRASHSFPLNTFTVSLKNKAPQVDFEAAVVQRIKRLPSIIHKLERFDGYRLSQIQDIGGCRAVLKTVENIYRLIDIYEDSRFKHKLAKIDDYIGTPQTSGYRGVHLIYKYFSDRNPVYNDLRIEIQLRSILQHAWATAVETVGTFINQALKSSIGENDWLRLFKLMGSVIAHQEGTAFVVDTPTDVRELLAELRQIAVRLDVISRLRSYRDVIQYVQDPALYGGTTYYLLNLNLSEGAVTVESFAKNELGMAMKAYTAAEQASGAKDGSSDVVLVSADSIAALQKAYPNYFADTRIFIGLLEDALEGKPLQADEAPPLNPAAPFRLPS